MSTDKIRVALETRVAAQADALPTAFEDVDFARPSVNSPYQEAFILFAKPENPTMGDGHYRQRGYLQIKLKYPAGRGKGDQLRRADLVRDWFKRGLSLVHDGITVIVSETPEIGAGSTVKDRHEVNVFIRFYADIFD